MKIPPTDAHLHNNFLDIVRLLDFIKSCLYFCVYHLRIFYQYNSASGEERVVYYSIVIVDFAISGLLEILDKTRGPLGPKKLSSVTSQS